MPRSDVMLRVTPVTLRQLKVLAALQETSMKGFLADLIAREYEQALGDQPGTASVYAQEAALFLGTPPRRP